MKLPLELLFFITEGRVLDENPFNHSHNLFNVLVISKVASSYLPSKERTEEIVAIVVDVEEMRPPALPTSSHGTFCHRHLPHRTRTQVPEPGH